VARDPATRPASSKEHGFNHNYQAREQRTYTYRAGGNQKQGAGSQSQKSYDEWRDQQEEETYYKEKGSAGSQTANKAKVNQQKGGSGTMFIAYGFAGAVAFQFIV